MPSCVQRGHACPPPFPGQTRQQRDVSARPISPPVNFCRRSFFRVKWRGKQHESNAPLDIFLGMIAVSRGACGYSILSFLLLRTIAVSLQHAFCTKRVCSSPVLAVLPDVEMHLGTSSRYVPYRSKRISTLKQADVQIATIAPPLSAPRDFYLDTTNRNKKQSR